MPIVQIEDSWQKILTPVFNKPYFAELIATLKREKSAGKIIYPPGPLIFNAFNLTPFTNVKVVILGQDPYHGPNQAHGLSFSVTKGIDLPPSLKNIYKELHTDLGYAIPTHGNLEKWAKQGVLLINAALTVEHGLAMSHSKLGWHNFTNDIIEIISAQKENIVFVLWGKFAQQKKIYIKIDKHCIIESAHPSPLSAHNGFWGSKPFSQVNAFLKSIGKEEIDWKIE